MRTLWLGTVVLVCLAGCRVSDSRPPSSSESTAGSAFVPEWRVIVPVAYAADVAGPSCGRADPQKIESFWEPVETSVVEIDAQLAVLLDSALWRGNTATASGRHASDYYRQYVGIVRSGRQLIYVNGFHQRQAVAVLEDEGRTRDKYDASYWRSHAIIGCDGGMDFFGVTYDPAAGSFGPIEFNESL